LPAGQRFTALSYHCVIAIGHGTNKVFCAGGTRRFCDFFICRRRFAEPDIGTHSVIEQKYIL
jgi:hypothetical protein